MVKTVEELNKYIFMYLVSTPKQDCLVFEFDSTGAIKTIYINDKVKLHMYWRSFMLDSKQSVYVSESYRLEYLDEVLYKTELRESNIRKRADGSFVLNYSPVTDQCKDFKFRELPATVVYLFGSYIPVSIILTPNNYVGTQKEHPFMKQTLYRNRDVEELGSGNVKIYLRNNQSIVADNDLYRVRGRIDGEENVKARIELEFNYARRRSLRSSNNTSSFYFEQLEDNKYYCRETLNVMEGMRGGPYTSSERVMANFLIELNADGMIRKIEHLESGLGSARSAITIVRFDDDLTRTDHPTLTIHTVEPDPDDIKADIEAVGALANLSPNMVKEELDIGTQPSNERSTGVDNGDTLHG